jgi:hypothetical protein
MKEYSKYIKIEKYRGVTTFLFTDKKIFVDWKKY